MAGVGVGVAGAVVAIAESTAQQVKQLDKLSQSYGLSIEQVSGLRAASKLTGVDMETLTVGMSRWPVMPPRWPPAAPDQRRQPSRRSG